MNIQTLEQPEVEPVGLTDVYQHLRLTQEPNGGHPDDALLTGQIIASRQYAEQITKRAFVRQKLRASFDRFPTFLARFGGGYQLYEDFTDGFRRNGWVALPRPPLIEIDQVGYFDIANDLQVVDESAYFVSDASSVPRLRFTEVFQAPCTYCRDDALQVDYYAGYPPNDQDLTANVPDAVKQAILLGVQLLYDNLAAPDRDRIERARDSLLNTVRVYSV